MVTQSNTQQQAKYIHVPGGSTLRQIQHAEFPEPRWAVPGLIPIGLTILAGRPKIGKSVLALQIAIAVATPGGGVVFGKKVEEGKVLYLAFEDNYHRIQRRTRKQRAIETDNITFVRTWRLLPQGGSKDLEAAIKTYGYKLVVIDTFARSLGKVDQSDSSEMTSVMGVLQKIAMDNNMAILIVDHHHKAVGEESSPIDDILGSVSKSGVADCAIGLYRIQGKYTLKAEGRDLDDEIELALRRDAVLECWQSLGNADAIREENLKADTVSAMKALIEDGKLATTGRIARFLKKRTATSQEFWRRWLSAAR